VPAAAGDTAQDIAAGGVALRAVSLRGRRAYQEDRFLVERGFTLAGSAESLLEGLFRVAAATTDCFEAGSTATAVIITPDLRLNCAFLGDSPMVLFFRDPKTGVVEPRKLTRDHHARAPAEKARIEREGGHVFGNGRLEGTLELSRGFGDARYVGVSRAPEFAVYDLAGDLTAGREVYLCLCTDGLVETLAPENYVRRVQDAAAADRGAWLADIFCAFAHEQDSGDNLTALTCKLPPAPSENLFLAVADGHGGSETAEAVIASFAAGIKSPK
jgi:serine/threonine protein phosphatase PrpC